MAIPEVLKNYNVFVDGKSYVGIATEVVPPKLTMVKDSHRAGGMDAPVSIELGMEEIMLEFTLAEYSSALLKQVGLINGGSLPIVLRGAMKRDGGAVVPIAITTRGGPIDTDSGSWKPGEKSQLKVSIPLRYYKMEINKEVIHEIDVENMVRTVNGVDQLAEERAALGI